MSDFELIQKAAGRIYPTHLKEHTDSSFVWRNVLPDHFKKEVLAKSLGSKTKSVNSTHSLTTKTKDGGVIEFNLSPHGKSHIAIAKYQNNGKVYSAIHSHEDPKAALKTVYDSVKRRMVAEEIEPILVEKMAKRIEKKTGKLSDKKEKIDVEPSEEKELKESTPPGMESWVKKNKANFVKEYGEKKGHEVLYATAWKMHDKMNEMEELNESKFTSEDGREFTTEKGRSEFYPEVHHVFHKGEHVGFVRQDEIQPYKKIAGSRLVKPLAKRKVWNFHLDMGHSLDGKPVRYRDSSGFYTKKLALESLARHHKSAKMNEMEELNETGIIEVIPHHIGIMPDGRKVSPFSAGVHHIEKTGKWTWGITDHGGNYTTGMSRVPVSSKQEALKIAHDMAAKTGYHVKVNEEELNELSKKTLASYVKKASSEARRSEYYAGRDYGKSRQDSDKELEHSRKRQKGINNAVDKLAESHAYTEQDLAKQIKYHENRAAHHDAKAKEAYSKAEGLTGDKAELHFNAIKSHNAIANLHRKHIYDLKSKAGLSEEQLNELSPSTLGRYIKYAAIQKANHAAHASISRMSQYAAENRKDKESAEQEKQAVEYHHKKEDKRTDGILRATDKLVRKASVKEDLDEAAHPDKIVMTSGIRKDLGGGYMAKTKSGNYYKLSWDALKLPNGSHDLPKLGSVLDVAKHKHIGKDKVDLNLLKEHINESLIYHSFIHDDNTGKSSKAAHNSGREQSILAAWKKHKNHLNESLDDNHPDMKAYHAACKARDEAHLASIRYRMNHDIKQPEHKTKYDELEAEHHRLRDIEDAAAEKVNGRLFAHHALKEQLISEAEEDHFKKIPEGLEWEPYSLRGYGSTEHGYKSKDGHWKVVPYHTTTYKEVKNTRLRDPGKTRYEFSAAVHHDGKWLGTKRFASVTGEHNRDKIETGRQKMNTHMAKKYLILMNTMFHIK